MRVLAFGATGFIGSRVVAQLVGQGHEVAVLRRGDEPRAEVESFAPEVVLDAILYTETQARELVDMLRGTRARIVALGSADVYRNYDGLRGKGTAPPDAVPLSEDAPLRQTRYPYRGSDVPFEHAHDYEKILVEDALLSAPDLPATILRLPAVYGPGDKQHRLRPYVAPMARGEATILLQQDQAAWRWTRGFVENVAAAIALAVTDGRSARRVYNVGEEPALTEREWVERIAAAAGWRGEIVLVSGAEMPDHVKQPLDWRYDLWTDTSRIRRELGYVEPVDLDASLERTVAWERSTLDSV